MVAAIYWRTQRSKSVGLVCGLAATRRSVCVHQKNRVNFCNGYGHDDSDIDIIIILLPLLWPPCVADANIIFSSCGFFYVSFFSSPNLSDRMSTIWCGLSANLECRSETCCAQLAANTGHQTSPKSRHLGTIPQLCQL